MRWAEIYDEDGNERPAFRRAMQNVEDEIEEEQRLRRRVRELERRLAEMESPQTAVTA